MVQRADVRQALVRAFWPFSSLREAIYYLVPITVWLPQYLREGACAGKPGAGRVSSCLRGRFLRDVLAGATCGVTVLPQGLAYATIVGLPAVYGLYCALIPPLVYCWFGGSPHLIVGPTAVMSLLVGQAASAAESSTSLSLPQLSMLVSFLAGVVFFLLASLRAGFVANFLSRPVVSGFTSAAGIIIGFEQLKNLLGISYSTGHKHTSLFWEHVWEIITHMEDINWWSTVLGLVCIAMILVLKQFNATKLVPSALIAVVAGCLLAYFWDFEKKGVALIGHVDPGFPPVHPPPFESFAVVVSVMPTAVLIALVGFMEAYSIGKTFAVQGGYELNANQELLALGLANMVGSFFSAYPATGSFSRTAVNYNVGATSGVANMVSAVVVLVTVLWFTELFFFLPKTCLAAIIISAVLNLFDYEEVSFLWRTKKRDLIVWVVTFAATLLAGIELGIVSGLLASVALVAFRMARPHVVIQGGASGLATILPSSGTAAGEVAEVGDNRRERYLSSADLTDDMVGLTFVSMLQSHLFMNAAVLKESIIAAAGPSLVRGDRAQSTGDLAEELNPPRRARVVVVDASACNDIDSTAIHVLADARKQLKGMDVEFVIGGARRYVLDDLNASRLFDDTCVFGSLEDALAHAQGLADGTLRDAGAHSVQAIPEETSPLLG